MTLKKELPTKAELEEARNAGMSRAQICEVFGLPLASIKRLITMYGLGKKKAKDIVVIAKAKEPETKGLMDQARTILGKRLSEDFRGYLLDKRPASSWQVIAAAGLRQPDIHLTRRQRNS